MALGMACARALTHAVLQSAHDKALKLKPWSYVFVWILTL